MIFADNLQQLNWRIILDILLVAFICYQIMSMLKGTRAVQVIIGMIVIFIAYALSGFLELNTLNWIISKFYSSIIVVVIVLFQDDLRRLLTRVGRGPFIQGMDEDMGVRAIEEVINAARTLSHERAGAIIVFERGIGLDRLYDHSVKLDALVNEQLLLSIFQSFSPLHDGAVIIQKGRLTCASAQLPLSKNPSFSKKMGTRHSAAVGIAEETDAVVLVVSEETGNISIAWDGQLQRQPNADVTRRLLLTLLIPQSRESASAIMAPVNIFRRIFNRILFGQAGKPTGKPDASRHEFAPNERRPAWGDVRGGQVTNARTTTEPRAAESLSRNPSDSGFTTAVGTVATLGEDQQRWSMSLRLPRHQTSRTTGSASAAVTETERSALRTAATSAAAATGEGQQGIVPPHLHPQEEENIDDFDDEDPSRSTNHRFVPPMPPEPPPRDVTVGGISLNPPIDHSEPPSKSQAPPAPQSPSTPDNSGNKDDAK
jgi:diadenylate cyclase